MPLKITANLVFWVVLTLVVLAACSGGDDQGEKEQAVSGLSIELTSSAFTDGEDIPAKYTCDGEDVSPSLEWSNLPQGTKSIALIVDDPDAPGRGFVHWVLYAISPDAGGLPEGVPAGEVTPQGARHGTNGFGRTGYDGPCPPSGSHRYFFKVYALDSELEEVAGADKGDLLQAMEGRILAQGQLMGRYQRQ
ncbi:MAG: YbhB/YbcL family Raf kinase inhibitor-like protein [Chloroflexi bacterium]|nr:YbhB/YbcL family Raf kinase inhibitor-like protein [Chloroflexota bacterium]